MNIKQIKQTIPIGSLWFNKEIKNEGVIISDILFNGEVEFRKLGSFVYHNRSADLFLMDYEQLEKPSTSKKSSEAETDSTKDFFSGDFYDVSNGVKTKDKLDSLEKRIEILEDILERLDIKLKPFEESTESLDLEFIHINE